ncbi:MAG: hypothetical protein WC286_05715 [Bacilli bacterium]|jgi:predicted ribosomally synthesized peptide with SipW-like signal peptide
MNKKNKVLITSIGLAIFSGIAATSSTFAWFSAVQNASVSFNSATVEYEENDLSVAYLSSLNTGIVAGGTANALTLTGANKVTDISGNGLNFYKPLWNATLDTPSARVAYDIETLAMASAGDADGYFVDFTLTISRTDTGSNGMMVYLGDGTEITAATPANAEDEKAVLGARLAVIDASDSLLLTYAPDADGSHDYIVAAAAETLYSVTGYEVVSDTSVVSSFVNYNTNDLAVAGGAVAIADLSATTSAPVTFRAWLEGEDADTVNAAVGGVFNIDLKIYGLSV